MSDQWHPVRVGNALNPELRAKTLERSGVYALRDKRTNAVVYVGESHTGHLWRTIQRHFQAPESFLTTGRSSFSVSVPRSKNFEVTYHVTSRGIRTKKEGDQSALNKQAAWIERFKAEGHKLKNKDDGKAFVFEQRPDEDLGDWIERELERNPAAFVEMGRITRLEGHRFDLRWPVNRAPVLAVLVDKQAGALIAYRGKVVRSATAEEAKTWTKIHWGREPKRTAWDAGIAPAPWRKLGPLHRITYTTRKGADAELVDYVHEFERTRPTLKAHDCGPCAETCAAAHSIQIFGGSYRVTERGIVG